MPCPTYRLGGFYLRSINGKEKLKTVKRNPMLKTYQYRVYPTTKQRLTLEAWLDACQTLYNQGLAMRIETFKKTGKSISYNSQAGMLTVLRRHSSFWKGIHIDVLQDTLRRLDKTYDAFYRRLKAGEDPGFPRFKGRGRYRSITFSHLSVNLIRTIRRKFARVVVPKIGHVKIRYHRPLPDGQIKMLTIQRKASGWYANITVEMPDIPKIDIQSAVGVDVGLESFLTTSEGDKVENPRHLRRAEKALKKKQRHLSRRKKGSVRRRKQNTILAKHHEHVANQRRDFHYKTAHRLFSQYDAVVIEGLTIDNMKRNHYLAKSISDAGWGHFRLALSCKAENAGKHLLKVAPHGTSQICSGCGSVVRKTLAIRTHQCDCGTTLDRDHNAAINILGAATALRGGAEVTNSPEKPSRLTHDPDHG
ncbi:transposase [Candidatus Poribacteria bacterium]|nr:MAG: transposase [Candidatus Poribacteria bacterium]